MELKFKNLFKMLKDESKMPYGKYETKEWDENGKKIVKITSTLKILT